MAEPTYKAGDEFVTEPSRRLADRHFVQVTRIARDGSWADIKVQTWAVQWTKRQPLRDGRFAFDHEPHTLTAFDLIEQEKDWMAKRMEDQANRVGGAARIGGSKIEQDRAATSADEPRDDEGRPK